MWNIFSNITEDNELEQWKIRIKIDKGKQPLPNITDIGTETLIIGYCLWNQTEYDEKLSVAPIIDDIPSLRKNTIVFPREGAFAWSILNNGSFLWESKITKKEFETAYCFMVWADPIGSAAFFDDSNYWKGVLRIEDNSLVKHDEKGNGYINHIIEINLNIAQGVISYFIDLVEKFSTGSFDELKLIHDEVKGGNIDALGKLGVMGPSLGDNDTCIMAGAIDAYEYGNRVTTGRKEDLYDFNYYNEQRKIAFNSEDGCINEHPDYNNPDHTTVFSPYAAMKVKWGQSNISIYDFKTPIKQLYAEMIRIGNDGRIYSNEGFSNINWGIVGRQLELEKGKANFYAALDPRSSNDAHDEKATNTGYEMVEKAALDKKFPVKLDRKILFSLTLKALRENDLFTCLGAEMYKEKQLAEKAKKTIDAQTEYYYSNPY
ncbi:hypothetical protein HB464_002448 [Salmonella enterica subsp. salamae]|uniref:Uncharacterized protein n=5 Tax=Salmonella enterica TaxID=28901 RepID=A0A6C7D3H0_SALER|nr:hypothetical protein [Salmonella enterica]EAA6224278.1 hypothetical protein [Salmonella enterica subsp. salamae]HAC6504987.1 hypothetical protein [Salmonella enterica subsp. salamae serovar 30:1,z28:z6]AXC86785.1 hypothetical protein DOE57_16490 [Salmonella enterica subsp. salamae serovar 56:b:[1,5]]EBI4371310.1 hypothetical protein [Salmonella enterica]ECC9762242.1 hypothetical protein [Salmonella enterica subsp. salamae]